MTIQEYFGDWSEVVNLQEADDIMKKLSNMTVHNNSICPQLKNVFKAFTLCPLSSLRVVITGQDPYPNIKDNKPVATGIAFANSSDTSPDSYSSSLEILRDSVIDFTVPHGNITFEPDLEKWERQGVLLLNAALSCQTGRPGSHMLLWRPFIKSLLTSLSRHHTGIVYVLMGTQAQSLEPYINKKFNHVIRCRHPAYYARTKTRMPSDIWEQVNNILISQNGYGINWF